MKTLVFGMVGSMLLLVTALFILNAPGSVTGIPLENYPVGHEHEGSNANYGISGTSTLETANGTTDSKLCVAKTRGGDFTVKGKAAYSGGITTVTDSNFGGGAVCRSTDHNHDSHRTGINYWGGDNTFSWGAPSDHDSTN
jgi:hypothetical protein